MQRAVTSDGRGRSIRGLFALGAILVASAVAAGQVREALGLRVRVVDLAGGTRGDAVLAARLADGRVVTPTPMADGTFRFRSVTPKVALKVEAPGAVVEVTPALAGVGGPPNDRCPDATALTLPTLLLPGSTIGAGVDDEAPACDDVTVTSPGAWYSVVGLGTEITVTTCGPGTTHDTKISVFCAGCDDLVCVAANDDIECASAPGASSVTWCGEAGTEYLVLVHGFGGAAGPFSLTAVAGIPCTETPDCTVEVPGGGCCLPDATCELATAEACAELGGVYRGDGSDCEGPLRDAVITVDLVTDAFGEEITWALVDERTGTTIAAAGPFEDHANVVTDVPVFSGGCYAFTILDAFGDGLCCDFGSGAWEVRLDGAPVGSGVAFGAEASLVGIGGCRVGLPEGGPCAACGDIDGDGEVDCDDIHAMLDALGASAGDANYDPRADFDGDAVVGFVDFGIFFQCYVDALSQRLQRDRPAPMRGRRHQRPHPGRGGRRR